MGFDHSVFGKFRERLMTSSKHKEALFELVKMITDAGLIKQNESQRTDSFHIIANVDVPAASELIREGIRICLCQLKSWGRLKVEFQAVLTALAVNIKRWAKIRLARYSPAKIGPAV